MQPNIDKSYSIIADARAISTRLANSLKGMNNIVALDGAADKLYEKGIIPHYVVGDLDSITSSTISDIETRGGKILHIADQCTTDMQKGISLCISQAATSINIYNAIGNRIDHSILNLRLLRQYDHTHCRIKVVDDTQHIYFIRNENITLKGEIGHLVALMAFPASTVTTTGLLYDVANYNLFFAAQESTSNSLNSQVACIKANGEMLLILDSKIELEFSLK